MQDLGQPASYLTLAAGAPVYSCDGKLLGRVEHVLAEPDVDVFDGIVLDRSVLPGGHRFVDAGEVEEIYERGLVLRLDAHAAETLPEPTANPGALRARPEDAEESPLQRKLRSAWDRISGRY